MNQAPPKRTPPPPSLKQEPPNEHDYITVITYNQPIGKEYFSNFGDANHDIHNPKVLKHASYNDGSGVGQTFHVPNVEALASIIQSVQNNEQQAIVLSYIPETRPIFPAKHGAPFQVVSQKEFIRITGLLTSKKPRKVGSTLYTCRNGSMMKTSAWFMWDLDSNQDIPPELQERIDNEPYINLIDELCPIVSDLDYVEVGSSSSRVTLKGVPLAKENRHIYMKCEEPGDLPRFASSLMIKAFSTIFGYQTKVRDSLSGKVIEEESGPIASIFDRAVFSVARVSFEGKPRLRRNDPHVQMGDIRVTGSTITARYRGSPVVDTYQLESPTKEEQAATRMNFGRNSTGFQVINNTDLKPSTRIEVKCIDTNETSWITMREFAAGDVPRYRAQNPFKPSSTSWSAFLSKENADGVPCQPFLYSVEFGIYEYNDLCHYFMEKQGPISTKSLVSGTTTGSRIAPPPPKPEAKLTETPAVHSVEPLQQPKSATAPPPPTKQAPPAPNAAAEVPNAPVVEEADEGWLVCDKDNVPTIDQAQVLTATGVVVIDNASSPRTLTRALIDGNVNAIKFDPYEIESIVIGTNKLNALKGDSEQPLAEYAVERLFGLDRNTLQALNARYINDEQLFCWNGKFWEEMDIQDLRSYIQRCLSVSPQLTVTAAKVASVLKLCLGLCTSLSGKVEPLPRHILPLQNGLFDWHTGVMGPFSREYFYTDIKEFNYDPNEYGCGILAKVMIDSCAGDADFQRRLLQMNGYSCAAGYNDLQKIIVYSGASRSGKSLLGKILTALTPKPLACKIAELSDNKLLVNVPTHSVLFDDEGATPNAMVRGNVAAIIKNITSDSMASMTKMYSNDLTNARLNIKMAMCCNSVPILPDQGGAISKRMEAIKFTRSFDNSKQDSALNDVLNDPKELSAMLNMAIAGYVDLLKSNGYASIAHYNNSKSKKIEFHKCDSSIKLHSSIDTQSTPMLQFITDIADVGKGHDCDVKHLITAVRNWAESSHLDFLARSSSQSIMRDLDSLFNGINGVRFSDDNKRVIGLSVNLFKAAEI